ncbi:MAG: molybdopterin-dependent oxidoreductase [Anaerolineae bacterium]
MSIRKLRRKAILLAALAMLAALAASCGEQSPPTPTIAFTDAKVTAADAPEMDWELVVTGAVAEPMTFQYQDLVSRDLVGLDEILEACDCGDEVRNTWEGIALTELLAEAGASEGATAVIFRGADGYWRKAAIENLDVAMVGLRRDGIWLAEDEKEGPIRMVVPGQSASYWMSQLVEIEVVE